MQHDSIFVKPAAFTTLTCTTFDCDALGIGSATPQATQASADQAVVTLVDLLPGLKTGDS